MHMRIISGPNHSQVVSSLPSFNKKLRRKQVVGHRRELSKSKQSIDVTVLERVTRVVTNTLVSTDQGRMVPGEPAKYVDGGNGITRLSTVSSPDETIHVCQPDKKLCALYPAGSINCSAGADSRVNFGVVGYKTALNPPPDDLTASTGSSLASPMYAIEITTPGCKLVRPYSFTVQRNSYVDPRQGAQCRHGRSQPAFERTLHNTHTHTHIKNTHNCPNHATLTCA